jgi:4-hydroxy-tetrahydrodipicolinate synthase
VSTAAGAAAIMVHQPLNPFRSTEGWVAYHRTVAAAVAPAPVVLYVRDAAIGVAQLSELAASSPNVVGVKYAVADPLALATLTGALGERLVWLCGLAEKWAPFAWQAGAVGFTSGLVNVADSVPLAMLDALRAGDLLATRRAWQRAAAFEDLRARRGGAASVGVVKSALVELGVIAGPAVRPPLSGIDDAEAAQLRTLLPGLAR